MRSLLGLLVWWIVDVPHDQMRQILRRVARVVVLADAEVDVTVAAGHDDQFVAARACEELHCVFVSMETQLRMRQLNVRQETT